MKTLFIVRYPSETDLFSESGDVLNEHEFRIASALIPEMRVLEVHSEYGVENDRVSRADWRKKWGI